MSEIESSGGALGLPGHTPDTVREIQAQIAEVDKNLKAHVEQLETVEKEMGLKNIQLQDKENKLKAELEILQHKVNDLQNNERNC